MTDRSVRVFTEPIGQELLKAVCGARSFVTIVSPYVTKAALDQILEGIDPSVAISIVTRWKIRDVALGVSQPSILDSLGCFAHSRVVLHQDLHAKIYVVDDDIAFVGSANVSSAGLGFSKASNLEAVVRIEPAPASLIAFLELLMDLGIPATNELRIAVETAAASVKIELDFEADEVVPTTSEKFERHDCNLSTFPGFRNPEYLYKCYQRIKNCSSGTERTSVLRDLAVLAVPDDLNETDFNAFIAHFLTTNPTLKEFDTFVEEPRQFGEMTEWLKTRFPDLRGEHSKSQRQLQTIIRWLRFFLPARYKLDQPRYTELFYRVD